jgi:hypothetical protein
VAFVEVAAVDYREALASVRRMLEQAGSAAAVDLAELRARRHHVLALAAQGKAIGSARGGAAALSEHMDSLITRIATELAEALDPAPLPGEAPAAA